MPEPLKELRENWVLPHEARLAATHPRRDEILARHEASIEANLPTYVDPASGFSVFTAKFLARRDYCCESGCRHCPYA